MFPVIVVILLLFIAMPTIMPLLVGAGIITGGAFIADNSIYIMRFIALVLVLWIANRNKAKIHAFFNKGK